MRKTFFTTHNGFIKTFLHFNVEVSFTSTVALLLLLLGFFCFVRSLFSEWRECVVRFVCFCYLFVLLCSPFFYIRTHKNNSLKYVMNREFLCALLLLLLPFQFATVQKRKLFSVSLSHTIHRARVTKSAAFALSCLLYKLFQSNSNQTDLNSAQFDSLLLLW